MNNNVPEKRVIRKRATKMRKNPTDEEYKLWYALLKNYLPQFHRQYSIGSYIVDFYCPKLKLVIEADGEQHHYEENVSYDEKRRKFIESKNNKIYRIDNSDINKDFKRVKFEIDLVCRERAKELGLNEDIIGKKDESKI